MTNYKKFWANPEYEGLKSNQRRAKKDLRKLEAYLCSAATAFAHAKKALDDIETALFRLEREQEKETP